MTVSAPELIENVFVAHATLIDGIKTVLPQEPDSLDRLDLPMLSMFFLLPEATEFETGDGFGPGENTDWRWEINLYVTLDRWVDAQIEMRTLGQRVVDNFRQHRLDYDSHPDTNVDIMARALKRRMPPTPESADAPSYLRASWELQVTGIILGE